MVAFLKALLVLPVAIVVVLLSIANRGPVTVSLDPFSKGQPEIAATVPLYALILAAVAFGTLIGGMAAWLSARRDRKAGRMSRREAKQLRGEADRLRDLLAASRTPALPAPRHAASRAVASR